ncbi:hypothetical protein BJ508DRAFT_323071 [Ascobolus immersus RN42]|uniref:Uncharacterized protein n=1 Tax=Ascobolus immersus RN42 TaxID=1160509 RepID=A0A3N4IGD7_ASCIM|nr:hypothetical protein BJ508DRAFT_323071 [Ascobolus immersus RN42]
MDIGNGNPSLLTPQSLQNVYSFTDSTQQFSTPGVTLFPPPVPPLHLEDFLFRNLAVLERLEKNGTGDGVVPSGATDTENTDTPTDQQENSDEDTSPDVLLQQIEDGMANVPATKRQAVEALVRQHEDKIRDLKDDDDSTYTEDDLLLVAKFYQFKDTDLAAISRRARQAARRHSHWNTYYAKHYHTVDTDAVPDEVLHAIQPPNPSSKWFELSDRRRKQLQCMMYKVAQLKASFAELQERQDSEEWLQIVEETEAHNNEVATKYTVTSGTRNGDRDEALIDTTKEQRTRQRIRSEFIRSILGWKDLLERYNYDFQLLFADPRTRFTWSTGTARGLKFQERRMNQMRCGEHDFGAFAVHFDSEKICELITSLLKLGKEREMYQLVIDSYEEEYQRTLAYEKLQEERNERARLARLAQEQQQSADGSSDIRGQQIQPDPNDDVFGDKPRHCSAAIRKMKESLQNSIPSNPLMRKGAKQAHRGRRTAQLDPSTQSDAPQTPSRVRIRDNRAAAVHEQLQSIWNQAMPGTLTPKGQFPQKAQKLLEAKGLTWVLPEGLKVSHIYKKQKPIYALRLIEAFSSSGLPRIVPVAAAPSSTS